MRATDAQTILGAVCKTYDTVAGEFSASRSKFWDELAFLVLCVKRGDNVLDIGCGNGRLFPLIKERRAKYTGIDCSEGLIHEAKQLHHDGEFVVSDALALPFQNNTFDIAYSFAVIHHIPGKELRAQFVREAARVLKPSGMFILSEWNLWNTRRTPELLFTAAKSILGLTPLDVGDLMLTFGKDKKPRYLHAFTKRELSALLAENGFAALRVSVIARKSGEKNIVAVARKNSA